jgi:hypothetical protein
MKSFYLIFVFIFFTFIGCDCDDGSICIYENKDVTVLNNTAYDITVIIKNNFNVIQVGSINSFETNSFNVPHSVIIEAGTVNFSDQLFVDPCKNTLELFVDE